MCCRFVNVTVFLYVIGFVTVCDTVFVMECVGDFVMFRCFFMLQIFVRIVLQCLLLNVLQCLLRNVLVFVMECAGDFVMLR